MKTLILCGGKGTRAYPQTVELPKPLLEVAGRPVLGHLMEIYAAQGFTEFVLAAGYRSELVVDFARGLPSAWTVDVVDTGLDTNTGGRVAACRDMLGPQFFVTYADGLGNVELNRLVDFHNTHPGSATVTTVPLPSQYGTLDVDDQGRVEGFQEKPRLADHLINAGFFV
ncbi:MAG TPA: sugar phosphate nucleotidyltransferase, partial [Acidimicrobiales bacterium]|nr:sugar phosphate nucleotidyltransferase [Acidimicrobiales bacterium]